MLIFLSWAALSVRACVCWAVVLFEEFKRSVEEDLDWADETSVSVFSGGLTESDMFFYSESIKMRQSLRPV